LSVRPKWKYRHGLPQEHGVVGDVLLVDVAVTREELRRGVDELPDGEVRESRPDDGLDSRPLLGIDVEAWPAASGKTL